ncbi:MAG: adenosylcobinamide-GDP ribazoletransferase [Desulfobulbaceae bacterium]|jgi:adenosylcobinamide-GDP ribazoletransferase|nr:adenosylcobinamide-GDP ribazoletransferase [Desulfobulbaceae bacterium]
MMKALILMIQFMTRYPIPVTIEFTAERFVEGMKWMPLVGLLAALPATAGFILADHLLGREVGAIVAVIALIVITGGLHLDGIADTADGLFSYRSRERMLEIMRDSTLGTNGVIALVLTVLLKYIFLHNIPASGAALAVLATPVLGRMALTWHSAVARYAREQPGIGDYVNQTGLAQAAAATLLSLFLVTGMLLLWGVQPNMVPLVVVLLHVPAILLAVLFAFSLKKRLGGITGDTIGATVEIAEVATFLVFLIIWKFLL